MDALDRKINEVFPGKVVRKDLTALLRRGANVPTFVLEYLLGMYCATDDETAIAEGVEKIRKIFGGKLCPPGRERKGEIAHPRAWGIYRHRQGQCGAG